MVGCHRITNTSSSWWSTSASPGSSSTCFSTQSTCSWKRCCSNAEVRRREAISPCATWIHLQDKDDKPRAYQGEDPQTRTPRASIRDTGSKASHASWQQIRDVGCRSGGPTKLSCESTADSLHSTSSRWRRVYHQEGATGTICTTHQQVRGREESRPGGGRSGYHLQPG